MLYLHDAKGNPTDWLWTAAHEFGHFIGHYDHYKDVRDDKGNIYSVEDAGWEGNMMARYRGKVNKANIMEVLTYNSSHGKLTGNYGDFYESSAGGVTSE